MKGSAHSILVQRVFKVWTYNIKMAYVRRRRAWRKKPVMRRRRPVRRMGRRIINNYRFKRLAQLVRIQHRSGDSANVFQIEDGTGILNPAVSGGAAWPSDSLPGTYQNQFGVAHRLNQLQQPTDFTSLYDRYKITGVKATFLYQINDASVGGSNVLPTILYAYDPDDGNPSTYPALRARQNCKQRILSANKPFSIFYRPKVNALTTQLGVSSAAINTTGFIDADAPNVDHFGMKFSLNNLYGTTATNSQLEIKFTYYFTCKDPQ